MTRPSTGGVVAFLQNLWVRDPERVKALFARRGEAFRRHFLHSALFAGCVSGRRLRAAFGDRCDSILWEETTRAVGATASSCPPADLDHMLEVVTTFQPRVVLAFGNQAWLAVGDLREKSACLDACHLVRAPHPASRHPEVGTNLAAAAEQVRRFLKPTPEIVRHCIGDFVRGLVREGGPT